MSNPKLNDPNKSKSPSQMAICFGVSLNTFLAWIRCSVEMYQQEEKIKFYRKEGKLIKGEFCYKWTVERKVINPKEIKAICELLGDWDYSLSYEKTTLTSLAESIKSKEKAFLRSIMGELPKSDIHFKDKGSLIPRIVDNTPNKTQNSSKKGKIVRCLTPRQAFEVKKAYGEDAFDKKSPTSPTNGHN